MKFFTQNLVFLRERYNLKQKQIAERLGVRPSNYNNWEKGLNYPKIEILVKLSNLYGFYIDDLLNADLSSVPNDVLNDMTNIFNKSTNEGTKFGIKYMGTHRKNTTVYESDYQSVIPNEFKEREHKYIAEPDTRKKPISGMRNYAKDMEKSTIKEASNLFSRPALQVLIDNQQETIKAQREHINLLQHILNKEEKDHSKNAQK